MGTYNVDTWQLVPTKQEDPMGRANRDADSAKRFLLEIRDSGHVTPETRGISVTFLKPEIELQEAVIQVGKFTILPYPFVILYLGLTWQATLILAQFFFLLFFFFICYCFNDPAGCRL
ncbi:Uncharacterized protein TCM_016395 [Theobroma cacao]|uniref:Uncharacterized protein n=1 Tax=Theobroma cacao TaxID=3641 RepID=A0A061G5S0_THECC|nr:Uncharacterized protein TCM_016395 [Theobroma cacao]